MKRHLANPRLYLTWTAVVVLGLIAACATDPYLFGFAVFALGALTAIVAIAGVALVITRPAANPRARWTVAVSLLFAGTAALVALEILGGFRWA